MNFTVQGRQATRRPLGLVGLAGLLTVLTDAGAQSEADGGLVLVQRTVDARYEESSSDLAAVLSSTLTKPYVIKQNDTLQGILSRKFSIGPTASPAVFEKVLVKTQELNGISNPSVIKAGEEISLPDMPAAQWKKAVADNPNYGIPRGDVGPSYAVVASSGGFPRAADFSEKLSDLGRKAAPLVTQWRWLTVAQAKQEEAAAAAANLQAPPRWSQPLTLKFAQASESAHGKVDADLKYLEALLKRRAPKQDVVLYVLDDSWPSEAVFEASRKFLREMLIAVRTANYFGDDLLPTALGTAPGKTDLPTITTGRQLHAAKISASLAAFEKLSPRVKVVYLPLFTQQKWAKEVWQELTYTALAASDMHSSLGRAEVPSDKKRNARELARQLVDQIPSEIVDSLGPAQQTPITVLQKMAQLYAKTTGTPYFISMSWTVEKQELDFGPDPDSLGVSLAASGNDRKSVMADSVYLAYRAKEAPGDVLAVMNTDSAGVELCDSSMLPLTGPNRFYGLAYDGRFNNGAECGSSFSTPRVAWLLALRQAYSSPVEEANRPDWYASFRTSVLALQNATQSTSKRYWLAVEKLFDGL